MIFMRRKYAKCINIVDFEQKKKLFHNIFFSLKLKNIQKYLQMSQYCNICYEEVPQHIFLKLACYCSFCPSCLFEWVVTTLKYPHIDINNPQIRCPNEHCNLPSQLTEIKHIFEKKQIEQINEILLINYLRNEKDVLNCPSNKCQYYGFIKELVCNETYECEKCGEIWDNQTYLKKKRGFWHNLVNKDVFSIIYEEIFTKSCPQCGILIYRTGGCLHMTCKKCEYEFCWTCKQNFKAHLSNICTLNQFMKVFLIFFHIFLILWKYDFLGKIVYIFAIILNFLIKFVLFYNGFFALTVYFLHYLSNSYKYRYDVRRTQGIFGLYTVGGLVFYCFLLLCIYGNFIEFFFFIITEILIIFFGISIGFFFNMVWVRWLYNVD